MMLRLIGLIAVLLIGEPAFAGSDAADGAGFGDVQWTMGRQLAQETVGPGRGLRPTLNPQAPAVRSNASDAQVRLTENAGAFEATLWGIVKESEDPSDYESYLEIYPNGRFAKEAKQRLKRLKSSAPAAPAYRDLPQKKRNAAVPEPRLVEMDLQLTREERVLVQRSLNAKGYTPGIADGLFGRMTRGAIRNYQSKTGFSQTGYLTAIQAKLLIADGRKVAVASPARSAETVSKPETASETGPADREERRRPEVQSAGTGPEIEKSRASDTPPSRRPTKAISALPAPGKSPSVDRKAIKQAITDYIFRSGGGNDCWGDINVVPSTECYLGEIKQIGVEKAVDGQITIVGRYTLISDLETREFTRVFEILHTGYDYRVLGVRPK